jgi:rare lipoprotein A
MREFSTNPAFLFWASVFAAAAVAAPLGPDLDALPIMPEPLPVELQTLGVGPASWYGPGFHGRLTANGETYNQEGISAAHRSLPFDTLLLVTRVDTGESVVVRVNDRGPYVGDRILDLSKGAARELGILDVGVTVVRLEILEEG